MNSLTNSLLGVAFYILTTNFHHTDINPVFCAHCTNVHHYQLIEVSRVTRELRVPVVIEGTDKPVERVLEAVPLSAVFVTNYVSDLRAAQSRARVPPMPTVPVPLRGTNR